jgi:flagellar biosynthesis protein FlhG
LIDLGNEGVVPEVLAVTSGKGGVGKTNISVNLALLLGQLKKRVLLVDADLHLGNVDLLLGLRPQHTIADVVRDGVEFPQIILQDHHGIDILPASSAVLEFLEQPEMVLNRVVSAFRQVEANYDTIVVDTGGGISRNVLAFVLGADKILLIVTPDPASIADAYGMVKVIRHYYPAKPILMVSNMVTSEEEGELLYKKMNLMVQRFLDSRIAFGGAILTDTLVADAVRRQQPLVMEHPNSPTVNTLRLITRRVLKLPVNDTQARASFFDRVVSNWYDTTEG